MPDKPMIFSDRMVRALLDARKTQTRRVLKPQPPEWTARVAFNAVLGWSAYDDAAPDGRRDAVRVPYAPGDRLWVRETWAMVPYTAYLHSDGVQMTAHGGTYEAAIYKAGFDRSANGIRWRSPRYMPRWASRLTLHVTDVRVQRVQEISEADAFQEGIAQRKDATCREDFRDIWDSLNAKRGFSWEANPWVVALTFEVERANIDSAKGAWK